MPFRISRISRLKIIVCLFGAVQLFGCAATQQTAAPEQSDEQAAAELAALFDDFSGEPAAAPAKTKTEKSPAVLDETIDPLDQIEAISPQSLRLPSQAMANVQVYDWRVINGAMVGNMFTGRAQHNFMRPVALAVQSEYLYVVDAGSDSLYRFDLASERLETLLDLKAEVKGEVADIYVDKDFSFYLTDTEGGRVLHYDRNGRLIQIFRDHFNMVRPVAITVQDGGDVIIADGHYDHLLHFNSMGKLVATYGGRGLGVAEFLNITAMAKGPDGYYVAGRVGRRVQVLSRNGEYSYAFEEGAVVFPAAIVVDDNNRSYVVDYMDNTIKVFDRGALVGSIGGFGVATGRFKRITDLWLDGNILYVIDGLNGRVQAARLSPEPISMPRSIPVGKPEMVQEAAPPVAAEKTVKPEPETPPSQE